MLYHSSSGRKTSSAGRSSSVPSNRPVRNSRIWVPCCMCLVTTPARLASKKLMGRLIRWRKVVRARRMSMRLAVRSTK